MTSIDWTSDTMGTGEYADVNALHMYYETHGTGRPLMLLHGGLASSEMFGPIIPALGIGRLCIWGWCRRRAGVVGVGKARNMHKRWPTAIRWIESCWPSMRRILRRWKCIARQALKNGTVATCSRVLHRQCDAAAPNTRNSRPFLAKLASALLACEFENNFSTPPTGC